MLRRRKMLGDIDEDIREHIERETEGNIERGMSPRDARLAAVRKFGNARRVQEDARDVWSVVWLERLLQDVRYGLRTLAKSPGLTTVAILTLALGIGANLAVYSLVDELWLRPRPVPHPERVVRIFTSNPSSEGEIALGYSNYADFSFIRSETKTLSGVAFLQSRGAMLETADESKLVSAGVISDNFFGVLAPTAAYGRVFTAEQAGLPGALSIVLSYPFWEQQFHANRSVVGATVVLDRQPVRVWGVLPRGFRGAESIPPDVWIPLSTWSQLTGEHPEATVRQGRDYCLFGRLRPDVTVAQANSEMAVIAARLAREHPQTSAGRKMMLLRESEVQGEGQRQTSLLLLTISALVLLIACANVTSLLIARAEHRRHEMAMRVALGAPRLRVLRQLLTEMALLGAAATAAALLLASWIASVLPRILPQASFSAPIDAPITSRVMWFALAVGLTSVLIFGGLPAWQASLSSPGDAFKEYGRCSTGSRSSARKVLVIAQIAVSVVLVAGAGLLIRSLWNAETANPGFDAHQNMLVMELVPGFNKDEQSRAYVEEARRRIDAIPGVVGTATGLRIPFGLSGSGATRTVFFPGTPGAAATEGVPVGYDPVSDNFFAMLGTRILGGRPIDIHDLQTGGHVIVINQAMAERFWPGQDPIGKHIRLQKPDGDLYEVVGVAENSKNESFIEDAVPYFYSPMRASDYGELAMVVKTAGSPSTVSGAVRHALTGLSRNAEIIYFTTLHDHVRLAIADQRATARLTAGLGGLGLVLATIGLYGLMVLLTGRRAREIGVRMALGARPYDVLRMVLGYGAVLALTGVAIGLVAAFALAQLMKSLLFGISPYDPPTFVGVATVLMLSALAACYVPARRAMRVDPMVALRHE
jgi:putative ABC transport system permease protein